MILLKYLTFVILKKLIAESKLQLLAAFLRVLFICISQSYSKKFISLIYFILSTFSINKGIHILQRVVCTYFVLRIKQKNILEKQTKISKNTNILAHKLSDISHGSSRRLMGRFHLQEIV